MGHLSVIIPDTLHQQLEAKTREMELRSISDAVRVLLIAGLEKEETEKDSNNKIQNKILQHVVTSYYLLKDQIVATGEEGLRRNKIAHEKGEKAMVKILGQCSDN